MAILHIINYFSGSTVYKNLIGALDTLGVEQIVYCPVKEVGNIGKNEINLDIKKSKIVYSYILNKFMDRIFYEKKIRKLLKDIESKIDISKITFIHAHTWYSDGGVAYLLHKKYNIPYIVATRNTDYQIFQKYFIHQRSFGANILDCAQNVI